MFEGIEYIRDYGVFQGVEPSDADDLERFAERNLVYGWNYSGKTTLSRIFRSFELKKPHRDFAEGSFRLRLSNGRTISSDELDELPFRVRVFNSDYIRKNLRWEDGVEPILVLGEENIRLQERFDRLKAKIQEEREKVKELKRKSQEAQKRLNDKGTNTARWVREKLGKSRFVRSPHLENEIKSLGDDHQTSRLSQESYQRNLQRLTAERRGLIDPLPSPKSLVSLRDRVSDVLQQTVERQEVARLREALPAIERWVEEGVPLHHDETRCHFCTQALPANLLSNLQGYFSDEYRRLKEEIVECIRDVDNGRYTATLPHEGLFYPELRDQYIKARDTLNSFVEAEEDELDSVLDLLREKDEDTAITIDVENSWRSPERTALDEAVTSVNDIIKEHNDRCKHFDEEREQSRKRLIHDAAARYLEETDYYRTKRLIAARDQQREQAEKEVEESERRLSEIQGQLTDKGRGAERINEHLRRYFGGDTITVELEEDARYKLYRFGEPAKNLSEGERTAIAFSYFLATLDAADLEDEPPVVYIDDPVSSLDSNHLFNTFAIIKSLLSDPRNKKARQLFVSTHDYHFFRLLKGDRFFQRCITRGRERRRERRASWYLIERRNSQSRITNLPPLISKFHSEYHYLFHLVFSYKEDPDNHEHLIGMMPNILRRVLEIYTSFRVVQTQTNLLQRLERLVEDEVLLHRIYKFVNHGSHSDSLDHIEEMPRVEECRAVIEHVLEMIERDDERHYKGLCEAMKGS